MLRYFFFAISSSFLICFLLFFYPSFLLNLCTFLSTTFTNWLTFILYCSFFLSFLPFLHSFNPSFLCFFPSFLSSLPSFPSFLGFTPPPSFTALHLPFFTSFYPPFPLLTYFPYFVYAFLPLCVPSSSLLSSLIFILYPFVLLLSSCPLYCRSFPFFFSLTAQKQNNKYEGFFSSQQ